MKDPYAVLGMSKDSSPNALSERYNELKAKYSEQRFAEGEVGNEGARLLSELEQAWTLIQQDLNKTKNSQAFNGDYSVVESLIRSGSYDEAQAIMDSVVNRDAQWHYYQSIIFYKREWLSESRAQLVLAVQLDPNNVKYRDSLQKIDMVMGNAGIHPNNIPGNNPYGNTYGNEYGNQQPYNQQQQANDAANTCANCMLCYCMSELCCSMSRCCG